MFRKPKVGLALGGGGARGLAHIGVLKVMEKEKIPINLITGTSAGALIGGMYAQHPIINLVENKLRNYLNSRDFTRTGIERVTKQKEVESFLSQVVTHLKERIVINLACSRTSLVSNKRLLKSLAILLNNSDIKTAKILFGAIASDLISGQEVLFTKGNMIEAVMASSSLPGFLPPIKISNCLLLDGGVTQPVPVKAAHEMGAEVVIAVDVSQNLERKNEFDNLIDIFTRTNHITSHLYKSLQLEQADLIIKPDVGQFHWAEFNHIDYIIDQGERATEQALPRIKKLVTRKLFF